MVDGTIAIGATLADKRDLSFDISNSSSYSITNEEGSIVDIIGTICTLIFVFFMIFGRRRRLPRILAISGVWINEK